MQKMKYIIQFSILLDIKEIKLIKNCMFLLTSQTCNLNMSFEYSFHVTIFQYLILTLEMF